jgi:hypothetical protein
VDLEITAPDAVEKLVVVIWLTDEAQYAIFNTSSEQLGNEAFSLSLGES